ncbi:hypothetical protein ACIPT3_02245 [Streptomyces diastaticus]|uniref:hypothetical protein n=1 Tax=Streptomyces diastaticus TaxID=1956 RepID=UPI003828065B
MLKRAKDLTVGDIVVTETGLLTVRCVASDMYAMTTLVSGKDVRLIFGSYEPVETLED